VEPPPEFGLDITVPRVQIGLDARIVPAADPLVETLRRTFFSTLEEPEVAEVDLADVVPEGPLMSRFFKTSPFASTRSG
jgi:hypothetical protein